MLVVTENIIWGTHQLTACGEKTQTDNHSSGQSKKKTNFISECSSLLERERTWTLYFILTVFCSKSNKDFDMISPRYSDSDLSLT